MVLRPYVAGGRRQPAVVPRRTDRRRRRGPPKRHERDVGEVIAGFTVLLVNLTDVDGNG